MIFNKYVLILSTFLTIHQQDTLQAALQEELTSLKNQLTSVKKSISNLHKKIETLESANTVPKTSGIQTKKWNQNNIYISLVQGKGLPYQRFVNWQRSAVVNPANSSLASGGLGEGAFIKAATGNDSWGTFTEQIRNYWRSNKWQHGADAEGNAVITLAGNLASAELAQYIIHAVGPCGGKTNDRKPILKATFENILSFADKPSSDNLLTICLGNQPLWFGLESIAISLVGMGSWVGDQGLEVEAHLVVGYVIDYLKKLPKTNLREARFITYNETEFYAFETALKKYASEKILTIVNKPEIVEPDLWQQLEQSGIKNPQPSEKSPARLFIIKK